MMKSSVALSFLALASGLRINYQNPPVVSLKAAEFSSIAGGLSSGQRAAWKKFHGWSSERVKMHATWDADEKAAWGAATQELMNVLRPEATDKKLLEAAEKTRELLEKDPEAASLLQTEADQFHNMTIGETFILINVDFGFCYEVPHTTDNGLLLSQCVGVNDPMSWGARSFLLYPLNKAIRTLEGKLPNCPNSGYTLPKGPDSFFGRANFFISPGPEQVKAKFRQELALDLHEKTNSGNTLRQPSAPRILEALLANPSIQQFRNDVYGELFPQCTKGQR